MKKLTNQELFELNEALKEISPSLLGNGQYIVTINQDNNALTITIKEKDYQKDFEDYLKTLDDDIFVESCTQYTKRTGQDLKTKSYYTSNYKQFQSHCKISCTR